MGTGNHRHQRGVLGSWDGERGFGFTTSASGTPRVFVHVSDFPRGRRPAAGCDVKYVVARDGRNRARASEVRYAGNASRRRRTHTGTNVVVLTASLFFALVGGLLRRDELPLWVLLAYAVVSGLAVLMYRADKRAATRSAWRTSESTIHLIALLGGWPGALVARQAFKHKTVKQPFCTIFWATVVANCVALGWYILCW